MEWIKKHKILTVILVLMGLGVVGAASGGGNTSTNQTNNQTTTEQKEPEKPKLDIAAFYSKVQNGMTKEQVVELAEKNPGNCTESETQGFGKYEICNWYGNFGDNAFATVSFQDGKVSSKSKTGF